MKIAAGLLLSITTIALAGCSSDKKASSVREQVFSDTAVTAFTQTAGVAINKPSLMDKIIPSAYAIDGNIRCVEGAPVSFQLDALGNTVQVDTTCNAGIDLSIRQGLLESLAEKQMLMYWGGGGDTTGQGRVFTFNAVGSFWSTYDGIGSGNAGCEDKLTFNQAAGTITIEHDKATGGKTTQQCLDAEFKDATAEDYKQVLPFRFINGEMQLGIGDNDFSKPNDLVKVCITDNGTSCK
jgi:hypothetical protein